MMTTILYYDNDDNDDDDDEQGGMALKTGDTRAVGGQAVMHLRFFSHADFFSISTDSKYDDASPGGGYMRMAIWRRCTHERWDHLRRRKVWLL